MSQFRDEMFADGKFQYGTVREGSADSPNAWYLNEKPVRTIEDKFNEIYKKHHEGVKNDTGKLRVDLIPPETLESLGAVLRHGATKYEDRNWEKGIQYNRVYAALLRHLIKWSKGEKIDADSGLSHLDHAFCNLMFLVTYERRGMVQFDNLTTVPADNRTTMDKVTDSGHSLSCV